MGLTVGIGGFLFLCLLCLLLLIILLLLFWRRKGPAQLELKVLPHSCHGLQVCLIIKKKKKEPDYVAITWSRTIVSDVDFAFQGTQPYVLCWTNTLILTEHAKRFGVLEKV